HKPVGAYEVLDELARTHKAARPPTVYRGLDFRVAEGLSHKIEPRHACRGCIVAAGSHGCQLRTFPHRRISEASVDPRLVGSLEAAARKMRFRAEHKVVEIAGLCGRCAA